MEAGDDLSYRNYFMLIPFVLKGSVDYIGRDTVSRQSSIQWVKSGQTTSSVVAAVIIIISRHIINY